MKTVMAVVAAAILVAGAVESSAGDYATVLKRFVDEDGLVDYAGLQQNRATLDRYARALADTDKDDYDAWGEDAKLAFWINAYNALTLQLIVDHYPISASALKRLIFPGNSIRQIPGAWDEVMFVVKGDSVTLDHIEHEVIRKEFNEPRIHVALVCAAVSCPPLRNEPYEGERLNQQLDDQSSRFLSRGDGLRIDRAKSVVRVSAIFDWFGGDFEERFGEPRPKGLDEKHAAIVNFIRGYTSPADASYLAAGGYEIKHFDYDWTLNDQRK